VILGAGLSMNAAPVDSDEGAVTSATLIQASLTVALPVEPPGRLVRGVICANGHFTNPENAYCHIDGISLVQSTLNVVEGPRPALGVLVLDDGSTLVLDADYVIGREPDHDPSVLSGESRPLILTDAERTVSRVHAAVLLENWDVRVIDRGSANGTFILASASDRWVKLIPDEPTTIKPGCQVRVGKREFLFESNLGRR
jgi:FHA domain